MSGEVKSSKELQAEMNAERAKKGLAEMPVMNNLGTSSGAIARRDKEFKGIIGTYKEVFKKKDNEKKEKMVMKRTQRKGSWTFRWLVMLAVLISGMLMLAGCGGSTEDTEEPVETETAQEETTTAGSWYDSVLADESVKADYPYYRLLDIDQDGVDELFLSSTEKAFIGAEDKAKLMADVDGEAVTLKEIGGAGGESFSYNETDKALFYFSRLSGEEHIVKYALENGELVEQQNADEYDEGHDPETGNNLDDTYYLDGKKVTESEADVLWDEFDDQAKAVTYSTDGLGNPNADDDADEPDDEDD